jgi:hypothetical protein
MSAAAWWDTLHLVGAILLMGLGLFALARWAHRTGEKPGVRPIRCGAQPFETAEAGARIRGAGNGG